MKLAICVTTLLFTLGCGGDFGGDQQFTGFKRNNDNSNQSNNNTANQDSNINSGGDIDIDGNGNALGGSIGESGGTTPHCSLLEQNQFMLHKVEWNGVARNHGVSGNDSTVVVAPTYELYKDTAVYDEETNTYTWEFYVYWIFHRERLNGWTMESHLAGKDGIHPSTFKDGSMNYNTLLTWSCKSQPGLCEEQGVSGTNKCLSGYDCNRVKVLGRVKNAKPQAGVSLAGDRCEMETTATQFRNRTAGGGCFTPWTEIRLANGDTKPIAKLQKGDRVWNPALKKSFPIKDIVMGEEHSELYRIRVGEKFVTVTKGHPFVAPGQVIPASQITHGTIIMGSSGRYEKVSGVELLKDRKGTSVINLSIDAGNDESPLAHLVEADGVVAGDLHMQQILKLKQFKWRFGAEKESFFVWQNPSFNAIAH